MTQKQNNLQAHYLKLFKIMLFSQGISIPQYIYATKSRNFKYSSQKIYNLLIDDLTRQNIIDTTIFWEKTQEGWDFWKKVDSLWRRCCKFNCKQIDKMGEYSVVKKCMNKT